MYVYCRYFIVCYAGNRIASRRRRSLPPRPKWEMGRGGEEKK